MYAIFPVEVDIDVKVIEMSTANEKDESDSTAVRTNPLVEDRTEENPTASGYGIVETGNFLGEGATSTVVEVKWKEKLYAMKKPKSGFQDNIEQEGALLSKLDHPNIIGVFEVPLFRVDSLTVSGFVMEKAYCTLQQFLDSHSKEDVPIKLKLQILLQLTDAVQYLHSLIDGPYVHGDISSNNVYLMDDLRVRLADFGEAAKGFYTRRYRRQRISYTPAENVYDWEKGARVKPSADVFSVGVVIINVISHKVPIPTGETVSTTDGTLIALTQVQRRQSYINMFTAIEKQTLLPVIVKCLSDTPQNRPSASEVMKLLQDARHALAPKSEPPDQPSPSFSLSRMLRKIIGFSQRPESAPSTSTLSFARLYPQYQLKSVNPTGRELGGGSFSVVYEVEWKGSVCAAKQFVLFGHSPQSTAKIALSLIEECRHWFQSKHDHILQTYGWYSKEDSPIPVIVMEKMDYSLKQYLESNSKEKFPFRDKVSILKGVASGLEYLHTHPSHLVHGDVTANNVMLKGSPSDCMVKLSDFGLTRVFDMLSITPQSIGRGTYAYISPEFFTRPPAITAKTDNFCFGVLMLHTVTHKYPIPKAPATSVGDSIIALTEFQRRLHYFSDFTLEERHSLEDLISQCLEQQQESRPTSSTILDKLSEVKESIVPASETEQPDPSSQTQSCCDRGHPMAKERATVPGSTECVPLQPVCTISSAIKQLTVKYETKFTADFCISVIRAENILSEYAVEDIESTEHPIKRTRKLFRHLEKVTNDNILRFCHSVISNSAFPPGTPEHDFARDLIGKLEHPPQ